MSISYAMSIFDGIRRLSHKIALPQVPSRINMSRIFIKIVSWMRFAFSRSPTPSNSSHRSPTHMCVRDIGTGAQTGIVFVCHERSTAKTTTRERREKKVDRPESTHRGIACAFFAWIPAQPNPNTQLIVRCSTRICFLSDAHFYPTESLWHAKISTHLHKHRHQHRTKTERLRATDVTAGTDE